VNQTLIKRILPGVFRHGCAAGSPLSAVLDAMVTLLQPVDELLEEIDRYFDPQNTPSRFVNFLAQWVDLGVLLESVFEGRVLPALQFPTGEDKVRNLIAQAAHLSQWRGTSKGLVEFLETATGTTGFVLEENVNGPEGSVQPFHFRLKAPASLQCCDRLVRAVVDLEKPAYVTCEIAYGG
jgi:phage tail-like protein